MLLLELGDDAISSRSAQPSPRREVRWTHGAVNVRADRGTNHEVVQTLDPGTPVRVDNLRDGWWEVYREGQKRGYVADSVLHKTQPRSSRSRAGSTRSGASAITVTLDDGSALKFTNVREMDDWACGTRKRADFQGGEAPVVLYYDRANTLVSVNVPAAGNEKIYDAFPNRNCVKNWKSGQFEMLTDEQYRQFEKQGFK